MQFINSAPAPLRSIEFIGNSLTDEMFDSLCHALKEQETLSSLQTVDLMDNHLGPSRAHRLISNLEVSTAKEIRLRFNNIGKEGCDSLASVVNISPCIQMIDIRGNKLGVGEVRKLFKAIGTSTTVTHLNANHNKLGAEGVELAARCFARASLEFLDLSLNDIGPTGARHLAALLANPSLTLRRVLLYGNRLGEAGMGHVCDALRANREVLQLTLGCNDATDAAAERVADMLARNETILELDLRLNTFTAVGVQKIAVDGLANNCFLQSLCLSGNPLGAKGASGLAEALLLNTRSAVERLDLSSCSLGSSGGFHIARFLCRSRALKELNLSDNQLDDESASAIAQATANSISISILDVSMNAFGEPAALCFLEAVKMNPQLYSLILDGNRASRATQNMLRTTLDEWLEKNRAEKQGNFPCVNGICEIPTNIKDG
ncbi:unnamed protein product [Phytomonas sp. Hart1]|nr:unnamed protein product [Phytomonas sp. Hart1]|eukprot:CCW70204.1 unnamed protein product [Phytomonas sp. isolate Hart1]